MRFLKAVVNMKAGTTDVVNILYYANDPQFPTDYTGGEMTQLGEGVRDAYNNSLLQYMATGVRVDNVTISQVNELNVATGVNTIIVGGTGAVASGGESDGRAVAIPIGFLLERVIDVNPIRVPKRSYIAHGPLASTSVTSDGEFAPSSGYRTALVQVFTQGHLVGVNEFKPYRLGVNDPNLLPAVGQVIGIRQALRVTVRRSRLDR